MFYLKALFVRLYGLCALFISGWSVWRLLAGEWLWLAPLLVWAPMGLLNMWRYYRSNLAYRDEREAPVMALALLGVALALLAGERNQLLWLTLAGLFGLLFYVLLASALPRGVRETKGQPQRLAELGFQYADGRNVQVQDNTGPVLMVFFHSPANPYSRMQGRELQALIGQGVLQPQSVVCVFADRLPPWSQALEDQGVRCWLDREGGTSQQLGLWLRGGASGLSVLSGHALRPAVAIVGHDNSLDYWEVASNYRLPPSLTDLARRLNERR